MGKAKANRQGFHALTLHHVTMRIVRNKVECSGTVYEIGSKNFAILRTAHCHQLLEAILRSVLPSLEMIQLAGKYLHLFVYSIMNCLRIIIMMKEDIS